MLNEIELGPIRPPSEAQSLLVRVTRGCHWNKCFFCGLYKGMRFSIRPTEDIVRDIEIMANHYGEKRTFFTSCFLQDGDAFNIPTDELLLILKSITSHFPSLKTITAYARSDSILRKSAQEVHDLSAAGLNHLYRGIETGSDTILKKINKGITADEIIRSGVMCKEAGMILSDFTLLGIGGKKLSEENAIETARVVNAVNPDFIRVHHTAFKPDTKLGRDIEKGLFDLQSEEEMVVEQRLFIERLEGIDSYYVNEHIVNLLLEVRGKLPEDKQEMLDIIDKYLAMPADEKLNFALGRRMGRYYSLSDMQYGPEHRLVAEYIQRARAENPCIDFNKVCNDYRAKMI